jgi:hypothetical protein
MNCIRTRLLCAAIAIGLAPFLVFQPADEASAQDAPRKEGEEAKKKPVPAQAAQPAAKKAAAPAKAVQAADKKAAPAAKPDQPAPQKAEQEDPIAQQFEQQFGAQFKHLYRSELHFLRVACKLTKPQFQKVAAAGDGAAQATKQQFLGYWRDQRQGKWDKADQADPRKSMAEQLAKVVQKTLPPEQAAQYRKELDLRNAAQKRVTLLTLTVMVDRVLVLSTDQRGKLREILGKNWDDSWDMHVTRMGGNYFPNMPDAKILPILTDAQKTVWQGLSKGNVHFGFYIGIMGLGDVEETWDDESVRDKAKADTDKNSVDKTKEPAKAVKKK